MYVSPQRHHDHLQLLNPYGLIGGLTTVAVFLLHGANFLSLKLDGELRERARAFAKKLYIFAAIMVVLLGVTTYYLHRHPEQDRRQPWHHPDSLSG